MHSPSTLELQVHEGLKRRGYYVLNEEEICELLAMEEKGPDRKSLETFAQDFGAAVEIAPHFKSARLLAHSGSCFSR